MQQIQMRLITFFIYINGEEIEQDNVKAQIS